MKTVFVVAALAAAGTQAQTVWRCGADGRSYSDSPCPEGRALAVVADARPAADVAAAQDRAQRDQLLAATMVAERRQREALLLGNGLAGIRHDKPVDKLKPKPALAKKKHRPEAADTWRAVAPVSRRTKG